MAQDKLFKIFRRDYLDYGSEVHVDIFDDRMEIYSPGGMFDGTKIQERNILRIPSRRRNPVLADIFDRLGYMERSGSGFGKILDGYESAANFQNQKEPEFYSDSTMFLVTLPNLNYSVDKSAESADKSAESADKSADTFSLLTERQREILKKMEVGIEYKAEDIENMIGLKHSRTRQLLMQLVEQGRIGTTAETKNRRYIKIGRKSDHI
jgi:ATP-dependent DNA helicase RecG